MSKFHKALLALIFVLATLVIAIPALADSPSPTTKVIKSVTAASKTYTGKKLTPKVTVKDADGKTVNAKYYTVSVKGTPKNAGKYTVTVKGKAPYTGTATGTFTIKKAANSFKIKAGKTSFKVNKKKNQTTTIKATGVKEKAKIKWSSTNSKVTLKSGKIIIKKGFRGTVTIKAKASATKNYKATTKSIKITVKASSGGTGIDRNDAEKPAKKSQAKKSKKRSGSLSLAE